MGKNIRLICVPYSGSSSTVFRGWDQWLSPDIDVVQFDYPGRGKRVNESPSNNLEVLILSLMELALETRGSYAFFGHSMGAVISYLALLKIESLGLQKAEHVFLSGFEPPHVYFSRKSQTHKLSDSDFIRHLASLGNIPRPLRDDPRTFRLFLPAIRHDFYLLETYEFIQRNLQLGSAVSIFLGKDDPLTNAVDRREWNKYSSLGCRQYDFEGNHFFVESAAAQVTNTIKQILNNDLGDS